ncbi:MAG: DUF2809 domain-containing protein [Ruminococcaceae bacterium]|nr:DUF2809 domain-containing protein [Oscillospiraceae bacterium]
MISKTKMRAVYACAFLILLAIEILIALYVKDRFIRPYGGDVLVAILICCLVRIFLIDRCRLLPLWVFLFSAAVEIAQFADPARLLGLEHIALFRIALGNTFSFADLLCYAAGCLFFWLAERLLLRQCADRSASARQ